MTDAPLPLVDVTRVEVIGDHRLCFGPEDGPVGDVAVDEHEWRGVFESLADQAFLVQVRVESTAITRPHGVDTAPKPLHEKAGRDPLQRPSRATDADRLYVTRPAAGVPTMAAADLQYGAVGAFAKALAFGEGRSREA